MNKCSLLVNLKNVLDKGYSLVSQKLQKVTIVCGDYKMSKDFIYEHTFVYFDPPYRTLTDTASFTDYTENLLNDDSQKELANFVDELNKKGAKKELIISNF